MNIKKNIFYLFLFFCVAIIFFIIRFNNLNLYNTMSADDGGGHIIYTESLLNKNRLPTLNETYLAWHEPVYYYILVSWIRIGNFFNFNGLNFWESLNILFYFFFVILVFLITYFFSNKDKWLALLNTFLYSILFVGVKLSSYVNNEVLAQTLILLLIFLFYYWKLLNKNNYKKIIYWSLILSLALLTKVTAYIILISAILIYLYKLIIEKKSYFLKYIFIIIILSLTINLPWIIYKHKNYNGYFSINIYNDKPKQNILTSDAWDYIFKVNRKIFIDYPYWFSTPNSYFSILLSDSFGDYYNLFNNYERIYNLPDDKKILTGNGRYTTYNLFKTMLNINRIGLFIFIFWFVGFFGYWIDKIKNKKINDYSLFLLLVFCGGFFASLYHNLRLPYLEVGVLKAHFIYFIYPIATFFSYSYFKEKIKNKFIQIILLLAPLIIYLILAWPILYIQ